MARWGLIPFSGGALKSQFQPMGTLPPLPSEEETTAAEPWPSHGMAEAYAMRVSPRSQASSPTPHFSGERTSNQSQDHLYHGAARLSTGESSFFLSMRTAGPHCTALMSPMEGTNVSNGRNNPTRAAANGPAAPRKTRYAPRGLILAGARLRIVNVRNAKPFAPRSTGGLPSRMERKRA